MSPQKKATVVSSSVAVILVFAKLIVALLSGSVALLASAIDSLLDSLVSILNFFAIKKAEEDASNEYQYGKGKVQAITAVIEGTVITISGLYIIYESIQKALHGTNTTMLLPSIGVMLFSIVITYALVKYLIKVARDTDNIVIKADALHYKTDLWSNAIILLALVLVYATGLDIIDAIFGFFIGFYIIYSAYEIIIKGFEILLDKALEKEVVDGIEAILSSHKEITSHHWLKTRTDGTTNFVEFHIVLRPNMLLLEAHRIADEVEEAMMKLQKNRRWIITPHFDPYDDEDINEALLHGTKHSLVKNHE